MELPQITCPHHHGGVCLKASNILGTTCLTSSPLCEISCKTYWHGPYNGRDIEDEQLVFFVKNMLRCNCDETVQKVYSRYGKSFEVWIPDCVNKIKEVFSHITTLPWVSGIALTGSILGRGLNNKDLDVVLIVSDLREYIDARKTLDIPKTINGLHVDLFASEQKARFFMTLDLNDFTLYTSSIYNITTIDPRITRVVDTGKEVYASFRE